MGTVGSDEKELKEKRFITTLTVDQQRNKSIPVSLKCRIVKVRCYLGYWDIACLDNLEDFSLNYFFLLDYCMLGKYANEALVALDAIHMDSGFFFTVPLESPLCRQIL